MTDMRERLIAMATYGSAYRGSGGLSERAATAERLVLAVERQAVERLLDKARKWHDDGTMTHAEWAAVCAVFYVEDVRPAPERIERIADALAPSPAEPAAPERCAWDKGDEEANLSPGEVCKGLRSDHDDGGVYAPAYWSHPFQPAAPEREP